MPTAPLNAESSTSLSVGCVCTIMAISRTVVPPAIALAHSWIKSAAWMPIMCTPMISSVSLLYSTLAMPSPSCSARALEFALKWPTDLPRGNPCSAARTLAWSSVSPTMAISGCVKHAAGMQSWFSTCLRPTMFSTAEMPCAEAACASIIFPFASPMHHRPLTTFPSFLSSTRIFSSTQMNPLSVSILALSRPSLPILGTLPVATSTASTSRVSTCSLVFASIILIVAGFLPGMPGVTSEAKTPTRESMDRGLSSRRSARRRISGSNVGMSVSRASMKVTSEPRAV
mmetsp:Transcript_23659/g.52585  ORF Transcript_23659/g.52585 Transcript_23659/m.52585 type:complete len:286 (+) Transcript_23659:171-1028(+)